MVNQSSVAQHPGSANPPDSARITQSKSEGNVDPPAVPVVNLLSGKSLMFPNFPVNNTRLMPHQKFLLAANNRVWGVTVIGTAAGAGISQARDTKTGYAQGAEGYFKRWGAGMAFVATSNMVGTFAIASSLHDDARYFVENSGRFRESLPYAMTHVFICRRDDGTTGTNWAGILGPLATAGVANPYLLKDSQSVGNVFGNWGFALAISAGTNMLREYWPHGNKKLGLPPMRVDSSPSIVKPGEGLASSRPSPNQR